MFERFTNQSRRVVVLAQEEARAFYHNYIGTEHILLGLVGEGKGSAARALKSLDVTLDATRQKLEEIIGRGQKDQQSGHIPFTPQAKKSLELSLREALQRGDNYIGTGHILLGMMRQDDSAAVRMLVDLGTDLEVLRERVTQELVDHPEQGHDVEPSLSRVQLQMRLRQRDETRGLLDTIDERLSTIEQRLGITRAVPDELGSLDERIAKVRRDKEAAIEVQDFDRAAALRDSEKQLLSERARVQREIEAGREQGAKEGEGSQTGADAETSRGGEAQADTGADAETSRRGEGQADTDTDTDTGAATGTGADVEMSKGGEVLEAGEGADELTRLRARLNRLEAQLREHNIEPAEPQDPPAAAG